LERRSTKKTSFSHTSVGPGDEQLVVLSRGNVWVTRLIDANDGGSQLLGFTMVTNFVKETESVIFSQVTRAKPA